jgi:pimeloyl-ACP methyl ester carboxylesterase
MAQFLLVPGACHGGWNLEPLAEAVRHEGHRATAVTLAGLEEGSDPVGGINLDTHVDQVVQLLGRLDGATVLVGHSYAGSVITGVADRSPERVAGLLYVDAFVPRDGESCWSLTNDEQRRWYGEGSGRTGLGVDPLPFFDQRAVPHPLGSLMQRSRLTGAHEAVERRVYLAAVGSPWIEHSPFIPTAARLRADPAWTVVDIDCGHNVMAYAFDALLGLTLSLA